MKLLSTLFMLLTGSLVLPVGFTFAESDDHSNQQSDDKSNQQSDDKSNQQSDDKSNQQSGDDNSRSSENETMNFEESSSTTEINIGQQISDFVHKFHDIVTKQRETALALIKKCHEEIRNASPVDRQQIVAKCKVEMKSIREQFQSERKEFQTLFKDYRESILALRQHEEGLVSNQVVQNAISQINDKVFKNQIIGIKMLQHVNDSAQMANLSMHDNSHNGQSVNDQNMKMNRDQFTQLVMPVAKIPNIAEHGVHGHSHSHGKH